MQFSTLACRFACSLFSYPKTATASRNRPTPNFAWLDKRRHSHCRITVTSTRYPQPRELGQCARADTSSPIWLWEASSQQSCEAAIYYPESPGRCATSGENGASKQPAESYRAKYLAMVGLLVVNAIAMAIVRTDREWRPAGVIQAAVKRRTVVKTYPFASQILLF